MQIALFQQYAFSQEDSPEQYLMRLAVECHKASIPRTTTASPNRATRCC